MRKDGLVVMFRNCDTVVCRLSFVMLALSSHAGEWLQYDDDKVSPVEEEKVLQLSGGGVWASGRLQHNNRQSGGREWLCHCQGIYFV